MYSKFSKLFLVLFCIANLYLVVVVHSDTTIPTFIIYVNQSSPAIPDGSGGGSSGGNGSSSGNNTVQIPCGTNMTYGCNSIKDALNSYTIQSSILTDRSSLIIVLAIDTYTGVNNTNLSLYNINITITNELIFNNNNNNNSNNTNNSTVNGYSYSSFKTYNKNKYRVKKITPTTTPIIDLNDESRFIDINNDYNISNTVDTEVYLNGLTIYSGAADNGAVFSSTGNQGSVLISIDNTEIAHCTASNFGGVFYFNQTNSTQLSIANSNIHDNSAKMHGGVIYSEQTVITSFYNSTIDYNEASNGNGIIYALQSSTSIDSCTLYGNYVLEGSIIHTSDQILLVSQSNFLSNRFTNATLYSENGYIQMSYINFTNNYGGSQIMVIGPNAALKVYNSIFNSNSGGSGLYPEVIRLEQEVLADIINSTFTYNSGGIIYTNGILGATFQVCSFISNSPIASNVTGNSYTIFVENSKNVKFYNNIFQRQNNSFIYCSNSQITIESNQTVAPTDLPQLLCGSNCLPIGQALCYDDQPKKKPRLTNAETGAIIFGVTIGVVAIGILVVYFYRRYKNQNLYQYQPIGE